MATKARRDEGEKAEGRIQKTGDRRQAGIGGSCWRGSGEQGISRFIIDD
jgi:hypothetical protein